ncbi:serine hydrolase domain-containing protein [Frateuria hangzhouensis]|uniref:serine hydrolase domain-containing protein n=1 Tax=Frateuria hangzhouensis TaxID=2995589 RepID=UPI0022609143|nr:serine hydrolase domain-containing protein [Frateuria sp. STR12]MCX7512904.1 serine hydrolase [Frateuria sp. STR12]
MQLRTLPLLIAGLLGAATTPLLARTPTPAPSTATATAAQLPPERVKATLEAYKQWLKKLEQRNSVAGLATAVVVGDKVVFEGTIGYANASDKEPVKPTTVFRLASLSKAFATAITALLVQDGKFAWDTRLVNVLPFFKLKNVPDTQRATVADILGQRLGLPRNTFDNMLEDDVPYEELVRKLDEVDMTCGVGECYGYQNVAFSLIGDVVYAMTGNFFYKLVDRRIFLPLGMTTASYGRAGLESSESWARPHRRTRRGWVAFEPKVNYYRVAPAAGVNASLRDMEKWLIAQMGGRPDVLASSTLDVLHTPGVRTSGELHSSPWRRGRLTAAHYALGWRVYTYGGETLIYHAGAVEGYRTMIGFFPKYHTGVVTMWNAGVPTPSGLMPMVFDGLLGLPHVDWAGLEKNVPDHPRKKARPRRHRH